MNEILNIITLGGVAFTNLVGVNILGWAEVAVNDSLMVVGDYPI